MSVRWFSTNRLCTKIVCSLYEPPQILPEAVLVVRNNNTQMYASVFEEIVL